MTYFVSSGTLSIKVLRPIRHRMNHYKGANPRQSLA